MNFIGSERTLLLYIHQCITSIAGDAARSGTFCDLFAGTGIVGRFYKSQGCSVMANDWQFYGFVLNQHYIGNCSLPAFSGLMPHIPTLTTTALPERGAVVCRFLENLPPAEGFVSRHFCPGGTTNDAAQRIYFSDANGRRCDAIRRQIDAWLRAGMITKGEFYFLLTTLLENMDSVANTASIYGAFLKKLKPSALRPLTMTPAECILSERPQRVFQNDANQLIGRLQTDILYLDPPYNSRQYAANYHVLETIARNDSPALHGKTGMRDYADRRSAYCSRRHVRKAFADLIERANTRYVFLSYNNEGLLTVDDIQQVMERRGRYGWFEQPYGRFQADRPSAERQIKATQTTEYIHYLIVE